MGNDSKMEKLFLDAINECGASKETLARSTYVGFVTCDYSLYRNVEENIGTEAAKRMQKEAWLHYVPWVIKDCRETLSLWEVKDAATAGVFVKAMYERISTPLIVSKESSEEWIGTVPLSPLVEIAVALFNEDYGSPYFKSLAETLTNLNREFVDQLGLSHRLEVVCDRFICLGDSEDRIILRSAGPEAN